MHEVQPIEVHGDNQRLSAIKCQHLRTVTIKDLEVDVLYLQQVSQVRLQRIQATTCIIANQDRELQLHLQACKIKLLYVMSGVTVKLDSSTSSIDILDLEPQAQVIKSDDMVQTITCCGGIGITESARQVLITRTNSACCQAFPYALPPVQYDGQSLLITNLASHPVQLTFQAETWNIAVLASIHFIGFSSKWHCILT
jgi:hypothetical protein